MKIFITIVGSRETPKQYMDYLSRLSCRLQSNGIVIRTGDASRGSDVSARSCNSLLEVYTAKDSETDVLAHQLAEKYHGAWNRCSVYAKRLHARNCYQIAGRDLSAPIPSKLVVCWTPDGCESHTNRTIDTGGTGTAISVAEHFGIPVFNLFNHGREKELVSYLQEHVLIS